GNGHFTAINQAVSYAQASAQPTVVIRAGTYNEVITVSRTAQVTIIGDSSDATDYSKNQVTVSNTSAPLSITVGGVLGTTWRNINFVNTNTGTAPAVSLRSKQNAFYNCQFISSGAGAVTAINLGTMFIANSYIEGTDKLFSGYVGAYVFRSTIVPTASSATIVYSKGFSTPTQFSQTVIDSCTVSQKSGFTNTYVYLAGPNGDGSQAVYKYSSIAGFIAPGGVRAWGTNGFYGEYQTTGPGSFAFDSKRIDVLMTSSMLSNCTIDYVFANSFTGFTSTSTSWVDSSVLKAISDANVVVSSSTSSSSTATSSQTSTMASSSSTGVSSSNTDSETSTGTGTSSTSGSSTLSTTSQTSSVAPTATCDLPSSIPSTAFVVGPSGSCAKYNNFTSAIAALPKDSTKQYIYILAGTYTEQIPTFSRAGATIFRGESTNPQSQAANLVTLQYSGSVLSSAGGAENYSVFRSTTSAAKGHAFYNINFENIAPITPNYIAIAMDIKALQIGFYSCGFKSGQGTLLANTGTFYFSGCRIEGSSDFVWVYGAAFISNSIIVSNSPGYSVSAQNYVATSPSQLVFDQCAFVPSTTTSMSQSTYLGRDYSVSARVAVTNSFLDAHIRPIGWLIKSASANVTFAEFNNTGPGFVQSSRPTQVQILTEGSAYSAASVLGDISWIDSSAVVLFSGFPASLFTIASTTSATSFTSATSSTGSSTSTATPSTSAYVVSLTPTDGQYGTVQAAIAALPADGAEKTILIMPGAYTEQININRTGKVTLRGTTNFVNDFSQNRVKIQFSYGVSTSAGQNELTPVINSKKTDGSGLALYNIDFVNTFPQTNSYAALAADFYGTNMAAYGCSFIGFQDTLLANKGTQLFSNCYVEGSVDFIWGFSQAYFHQCYIATNTPGSCIAAQSRSSASVAGGYVFDACTVTYTGTYGSSFGLSYLGRPYSNFSVAVYKNSYIDKHINAAGWNVWSKSNPQTSNVLFGEYNNVGPSAWTASTTRASFATNLTDAQVAAYDLSTFLGSTSWIDMEAYNFAPSYNFSASGINGTPTTAKPVPSATPTANSTTTRPTSGTTPPAGAILVSVGGTIANSFSSLTSALASLPADTTSQTIFMYPGSYTEQVSVNRKGPVTVIGYQSGSVGKTYTGNQVTLTFARGLSIVAPVAAGHTNAETAVIATASTKISFYNVNFINTDNLDGAIASYVTLAASVYGDQIGFYGCSFVGWQDTVLTGNPSGYAYYESSYIDGAIDFIWGYSMSYFKGCTIGAKRAKSAITAHNRASLSAVGGYIFDQCLFTAAANATADLNQQVYLGRPYNAYARVVVKYSYLDSIIQPAGWKVWSTTDPRTDYITFAEFQNTGPGNWESNAAARASFGNATLLTSDTYSLSSVMASTSWIDMTYWNSIVTPQPTVVPVETANSTTPPSGACIVSKTAITGKVTYTTIAQCIALLPTTSAVSTIFIYPGTYNEQLTFNRSGATIFQGYAEDPTKYSTNQVIITNSAGVDTQGDASNSDSATFYSRGKNVKFYNINLVNTFGKAADYASLGFSVGNNGNASFYGCQILGNQDTFNVNVGNTFAYNTYIEGSIDFIWGSGSMYFLASKIAPNTNGISITADKRATNMSIGGIVFDQCTVTPASGSGVSAGTVYLGRPWNPFARVAYVKTNLDSSVNAAGWSVWSKSTPNTDTAFFGEYQNTGPGAVKTSRASFSHEMTDNEATAFQLTNFFSSTSWIDFTAVGISPFVISSTILSTEPDVYKSTAVTLTETSFLSITPAVKSTTVTLDQVVKTTLTIQGSSETSTKLITSKVTAVSTVTPAPVTQLQTVTISNLATSTLTPNPVSKVVTSISTLVSTTTSTPKGKTNTIKSTSTLEQLFTAAAPDVKITQTSTISTTTILTSTPKGVTKTTTYFLTIPAGPTVTVQAKAVTSLIPTTSVVFKTTKSTTTLACIPSAAKVKRSFEAEPYQEDIIVKRQTASGSSSVSTPTVTTFYTLPQSTSTLLVLVSASTTTTKAALTSTQTDTITSYILKTSVFSGKTFTSTISTTKIVPKTTTLPQSISTILVDLQGTSISTVSLKGQTQTVSETIFSTVKTSTSTALGLTIQSQTTKELFSTSTITLPAQTILTTTTSLTTLKATVVLPTSTLATSVHQTTVTLPTSTVLISQTSTSKIPTPSVTVTSTVRKTTTVKSTSLITSTVVKTAKGAPTCS
ncbi:carbohydrate esterase family 8 protein, partial [Cadophora sp. DSE1049]